MIALVFILSRKLFSQEYSSFLGVDVQSFGCRCLTQAIFFQIVAVHVADAFLLVAICTVDEFDGKAIVDFAAVFPCIGYASSIALWQKVIRSQVVHDCPVWLPVAYRPVSQRNDFKLIVGPKHEGVGDCRNLIDDFAGSSGFAFIHRRADQQVSSCTIASVIFNTRNFYIAHTDFIEDIQNIISRVYIYTVTAFSKLAFNFKIEIW